MPQMNGAAKLWHVLIICWITFLAAITVTLFLNSTNVSKIESDLKYIQEIHTNNMKAFNERLIKLHTDIESIKNDLKQLLAK
jgi:hypothetical protein